MNRTERNALRKAQAAERKTLADALKASRKDEKLARREAAEREQSERDARAAESAARQRDSYRTMCRGLVMSKVRLAGGRLDVVRLAQAWPPAIPRASLDEAIDTLCGANELTLQTFGAEAVLSIPASLSVETPPAGGGEPAP